MKNKFKKKMRKELARAKTRAEREAKGLVGCEAGYMGYRLISDSYVNAAINAFHDVGRMMSYDEQRKAALGPILDPRLRADIEFFALVDEYAWIRDGRTTLFPQSVQLVEQLTRANIKVPPEAFRPLGKGTVLVAMPKGFEVDGVQLPSFLFGVHDLAKWDRDLTGMCWEWGGHEFHLQERETGIHVNNQTGVSISYNAGIEKMMGTAVPQVITNARLPLAQLSRAVVDPTYLSDMQARTEWDEYTVSLEESELKLQRVMLKIGFGLMIYANVFPEAVTPGFPDAKDVIGRERLLVRAPKLTVAPGHQGGHKITHFRNWTFHTLVNERFKRGDDGKPRVVFVKPTWVNAKIDPVTIEES